MRGKKHLVVALLAVTMGLGADASASTVRTFEFTGFKSHITNDFIYADGRAVFLFDDEALDAAIASLGAASSRTFATDAVRLQSIDITVRDAANNVLDTYAVSEPLPASYALQWIVRPDGLAQIRVTILQSFGLKGPFSGYGFGFSSERIMAPSLFPGAPLADFSDDLRDEVAQSGRTSGSPISGCAGSYVFGYPTNAFQPKWFCSHVRGALQGSSVVMTTGMPAVIPVPAAGWLLVTGLGGLGLLRTRRQS
jgi:hypothetical protein